MTYTRLEASVILFFESPPSGNNEYLVIRTVDIVLILDAQSVAVLITYSNFVYSASKSVIRGNVNTHLLADKFAVCILIRLNSQT